MGFNAYAQISTSIYVMRFRSGVLNTLSNLYIPELSLGVHPSLARLTLITRH
jgi:hypothetical protein